MWKHLFQFHQHGMENWFLPNLHLPKHKPNLKYPTVSRVMALCEYLMLPLDIRMPCHGQSWNVEFEVLQYCSVLFIAKYNVVEAELKGLWSPRDKWEEKLVKESGKKDVNKLGAMGKRYFNSHLLNTDGSPCRQSFWCPVLNSFAWQAGKC